MNFLISKIILFFKNGCYIKYVLKKLFHKQYAKYLESQYDENLKSQYKKNISIEGINNNIPKGLKEKLPYIKICGNNNTIIFDEQSIDLDLNIQVFGSNNIIILQANITGIFRIQVGAKDRLTNNTQCSIGKNTSSNGCFIILFEDRSIVRIGNDCMFSTDIEMWASDTHTITDINGKILNYGYSIEIGNHVWLSAHTTILKNSKISDNSISAWGSVVTKKFNEKNIILGGIPAKVLKKSISWDIKSPSYYRKETKNNMNTSYYNCVKTQ